MNDENKPPSESQSPPATDSGQGTLPPPMPTKKEVSLEDYKPLENDASIGTVFEGMLKHPYSVIASIRESKKSGEIATKMVIVTIIGIVIFGITMGSFSLGHQLWAVPLKSIFGLAFSAIICLPSLYIFSALTGTSLKLVEIVQGLAVSLALMAALLLGFTPVLWVFSQSTHSEVFFGFLVLSAWLIAVFFGGGFLIKMLRISGTKETSPVTIWIGIFLLVTLQMSTTLRPLIGTPDTHLTNEKRFFLEHWTTQMRESD